MQESLQLFCNQKIRDPWFQVEIEIKRDHCSATHKGYTLLSRVEISSVTPENECLATETALRQTCQPRIAHNTIFHLQALKVIETFTDIGSVHEARTCSLSAAGTWSCSWGVPNPRWDRYHWAIEYWVGYQLDINWISIGYNWYNMDTAPIIVATEQLVK